MSLGKRLAWIAIISSTVAIIASFTSLALLMTGH